MTNDKQIEAAWTVYLERFHAEWEAKTPEQRYNPRGNFSVFKAGYQAAIATTHEQYKPLVEALRFLLEANKEWATTYELAWPNNAVHLAEQALASIPEEQSK